MHQLDCLDVWTFSYFIQDFITLIFFVVINVSTNMSDTDTANNVADPTPDIEISSEELRNMRIRRFAQQPIRYRQSIGEQVLNNGALANSELADASDANSESDIQSSVFDCGDEEANKFLQDVDHSIV